jgi:hypothetical protein
LLSIERVNLYHRYATDTANIKEVLLFPMMKPSEQDGAAQAAAAAAGGSAAAAAPAAAAAVGTLSVWDTVHHIADGLDGIIATVVPSAEAP